MAAPQIPAGYKRYRTKTAIAVDAPGSLFEGQTVENNQLVDLPDTMFTATGSPVKRGGNITGVLTEAIDGVHSINEWFPSTDTYVSRNFTVVNVPYTGYVASDVSYKYYPINNGGNIVMNDPNSFNTVEEIVEYLNNAPGNPFTSYAMIPQIQFSEVP